MEKIINTSDAGGSGRLHGLNAPVWAERVLGFWMATLAFLLPFKFGASTSQNAPISVPLDFLSVLFWNWPPTFLCAASAAALAMTVMLWSKRHLPNPASWALLGWGAMALVAISLGRGSEQSELLSYTWLAVLFFGAAVLIARRHHSRVADLALAGLVIGTLLTALSGLNQYFFGFAEMQEQMLEMNNGAVLDPRILEKAKENLVKCNFAYSNSLGGHLLLCGPVAAAWFYEKGRERPWGPIAFGIAAVLLVAVFLLTRSRAALVAMLLAGALVALWRYCRGQKLVIGLTGLLVLSLLTGYLAMKIPSFQVRLDYWRVCLDLFRQSPLTGGGTGSFQNAYLVAKDPGLQDAVLSHSLVMGQLAENGLLGLLPWLVITGSLIAISFNASRHSLYGCAFAWGLLGWWLHAQVDFDAHIPASAAACVLLLALAPQLRHDRAMPKAISNLVNLVLLLGAAICLLLSLHSSEGYRRCSLYEREMFGDAWVDTIYSHDFAHMEQTFRERLAAKSCPFCGSDKIDARLWNSQGRCSDCGSRAHAGLVPAAEILAEAEIANRLLPRSLLTEGIAVHKLIYSWKIGQMQHQLHQAGAPGRAEIEDFLAAAESYLRPRLSDQHKDAILDLSSILALRGAPPSEIAALRRRAFGLQPWSPDGAKQNAEWSQMMLSLDPKDINLRGLLIVSRASSLLQSLRSELINRRWHRGNDEIDLDKSVTELRQIIPLLKQENAADAQLILQWIARTEMEFGVHLP